MNSSGDLSEKQCELSADVMRIETEDPGLRHSRNPESGRCDKCQGRVSGDNDWSVFDRLDVDLPENSRRGSVSEVLIDFGVPGKDIVGELRGSVEIKWDMEYVNVNAQRKEPRLRFPRR